MRKFGKESTAPTEGVNREGGGWLQNHCALAVCIVVILAFIVRTVFAYGISADGGFALSGGSDAQYHLHVVESILNGSFILGSDAAINYPVGGLNVNAPLYDFIAAGVGSFAGASTALAVLAPIFGALTCFPVYLIGKELYGYKAGFVAALIFGLMALPIVSTVFSNGTEYAFVAFLLSFFILALIKVARKISDDEFAKKEVLIAGILLGLVVLSWNDFRAVIVLLAVIMAIQMVLDRFNSKDFSVTLYSYSIIMLIGLVIGAIYYIPANLWDAVFSGPVLIAVITIAFGFIFKGLQKTPWIITIPGLIIAFIVIAVVFYFVLPDYFTALIFGNSSYTNSIMSDLSNTNISISRMSSYYGWLLMWMPAILGLWEFYVYARKDRSHNQLFVTATLLVLWMFAWTSYSCAASLGMIFAVSSAQVLVAVIGKADLKTYWASMKTAGFPGCFRKMIKPLPFLSVLIAVFLVIVPGIAYAIDAGIPSNADSGYFAYGNTTYTIETGEGFPVSYVYDDLEIIADDSAVVSWIDYAAGLEARGFNTVNDMDGAGASVAAQIYLAEGASGATAVQIVRLIQANPDTNFEAAFIGNENVLKTVKEYLDDAAKAKDLVLSDSDKYGALSSDITDEDASYIAGIKEITDNISSAEIIEVYEDMMVIADEAIGYYIVDGSMVPLVYGDGSSLSTIAYFAGYNTDSYGAATQFYSYITWYTNYYPANATSALYDTFLWKALIGPSPSDMGYSSSFSYLYDLTTSDGKVKTMPGYGLAGYEIASWYVKYNENPKATTADDGWEYMPYETAIAKQQADGGLINYLSSIIAFAFVGDVGTSSEVTAGRVVDETGAGIEGITVSVSYFNAFYGADTVYSQAKTDANGEYTILVPTGNYYTTYKNGDVKLEASISGTTATVDSAEFVGVVAVGETIVMSPNYMYVLKNGSIEYYIQSDVGLIDSADAVDAEGNSVLIIPGTYSYELRDGDATAVGSGTITLYTGENTGLRVSPTNYTITATVTDFFGQKVDGGVVIATNATTGETYGADVEEGTAVIYVPSGTYTVKMIEGYVSLNTTSLSVTSNKTVSITAYEAEEITIVGIGSSDLNVYGGAFSTISDYVNVSVPLSIGTTMYNYTLYGMDGEKVYLGVYKDGTSVTVSEGDAIIVSGSIGTSGTVSFVRADGATINAVAGTDGKFSVPVLAGDYVIYANNGSDKVYIASENITADKDLGTISLVDGRKITETYQYASGTSKSNVALPFAYAKVQFTYGSVNYEIPTMTDTSGKAVFYVPDEATSVKVIINDGLIANGIFTNDELFSEFDDGTSDASKTITISGEDIDGMLIQSDYAMKLTPYSGGDDIEFEAGESKSVAPGQYTAKIDAATGHYFNGTVYVYPGEGEFSGLNVIDVFGITILKGETDTLTITGDKTHDNYNGDDVYYFEYGCEYTLKTVNMMANTVKYATVYREYGEMTETIDMTTSVSTDEVMKIKGFVGAIADGTVYVTYDETKVEAEVSSGEFEIELPISASIATFRAEVTSTVSSQKYGFSGENTVNALTDGTIVNIPVSSDDSVMEGKYTSDLDGRIVSANFDAGVMTVDVEIFNNTDLIKTYAVTAGSAWTLDSSEQYAVASKDSRIIELTGTYEPNGVGIGSLGMSVTIKDYNGTTSKTIQIIDGTIVPSESIVTLKTAADSTNKDKISGNEYQYALTFVNSGAMNEVNINASVDGAYFLTLMNEDGTIIKGADANESVEGTFIVPAQSSTVVYVKVMATLGELDTVPTLTVDTSVGSKTLTPSTIDISVDSITVSGDSAVSSQSGVPMGVWFIFGLSIILLILIVWMGSKRGVFSRR